MKYELKRDFYYSIYKGIQPRYYNTKIDIFDDLVSLRDYIYQTYRTGYTIEEVGLNFRITSDVTSIFCYVNQI